MCKKFPDCHQMSEREIFKLLAVMIRYWTQRFDPSHADHPPFLSQTHTHTHTSTHTISLSKRKSHIFYGLPLSKDVLICFWLLFFSSDQLRLSFSASNLHFFVGLYFRIWKNNIVSLILIFELINYANFLLNNWLENIFVVSVFPS